MNAAPAGWVACNFLFLSIGYKGGKKSLILAPVPPPNIAPLSLTKFDCQADCVFKRTLLGFAGPKLKQAI